MVRKYGLLFVFGLMSACSSFNQPDDPSPVDESNVTRKQYDSPSEKGEPPMLPPPASPDEDPPEYVTNLVAGSDCFNQPKDIAVPKEHAAHGDCEWLTMTPAMDDGMDFFEVGGNVWWASMDEDIATISCDAPDGRCWPVAHRDLFDAGGVEPTTEYVACVANNGCPTNVPDGFPPCQPLVCDWFSATSVVNLEGAWALTGAHLDGTYPVTLAQNGRDFADPATSISKGRVNGTGVSFTLDDTGFAGELVDRNHMGGTVIDLLEDETVGVWTAVRLE